MSEPLSDPTPTPRTDPATCTAGRRTEEGRMFVCASPAHDHAPDRHYFVRAAAHPEDRSHGH